MSRFGNTGRAFGAIVALALCVFVQSAVAAVPVVTRFRSPKNADRPVRKGTSLIVLHTTEAPAKGSLRHLSERGECHYCVTEDGTVYQIVDRHRVAFHAGTSMWNGKTNVDNFSVGIECVGYHDKAMPMAQIKSIRALVKELQGLYKLSDDKVVTHSMVAYSEPNKWHRKKCRGRKRCGMLFAMPSVRAALGLKKRAAFDPDVKAKRLVVGDDTLLPQVLYGKRDTMRKAYGTAQVAALPKKPLPPPKGGAAPAVRPSVPVPAPAFRKIPQSIPELKAQGFVSVGSVAKKKLPINIVGAKWNSPDTYYTIRGRVIAGNILDPYHVEEGMNVWVKK